jgi:photosystem II stability/assembly factor-like uncharacterized protein
VRRGASAVLRLWAGVACLGLLAAPVAPAPSTGPVVTNLTLFAGTAQGLMRSTDWGHAWNAVTTVSKDAPDPPGAVRAILALGMRVYVGGENGLLVSDDFGQTWRALGQTGAVHAVLPSRYPLSDPTVWVGTAGGLRRSTDLGRTFEAVPVASGAVAQIEWPGPDLVIAGEQGVFTSVDGGMSFRGPGTGLPPGRVHAMALSSYYGIDPVLFASVEDLGVFRSSDKARTWVPTGLSGWRVDHLLWIGPQLFAAGAEGIFRSEDAGRTWTKAKGLSVAAHCLLFPVAPDSTAEAFAATEDGVYHTADGGLNWTPWGMRGQPVLTIATFPPPDPVQKKRR